MAMKKGANYNHPKKGASLKVEPIRDLEAISAIKALLNHKPVYATFFCLAINTAFRTVDLLNLVIADVMNLHESDELTLKEQKTGKYRTVSLNQACQKEIQRLLDTKPNAKPEEFLFTGQRGQIKVPTISQAVKSWCKQVGLSGQYAAHSLRKTWGYHQRVTFKESLPVLMKAYNHSSELETLNYLCIQQEEVSKLYKNHL